MQTTVNGITLSYSDEGNGTPLLFVHGFPLSRRAWHKQIGAFKNDWRVIAPDLRGHGESDTTPGMVTMSRFAADLHALILHLGLEPVVLIGHSMGGYIAFAFARQFPEMLRGLVLAGTKPGNDTFEAGNGRRAMIEKVLAQGSQAVIDAMAPKMLAPENHDAAMARDVRAFMARSTPEGVVGALLGMRDRPDSTPMLADISVPALVITGADDTIIPAAESEKMAKAIKGAQLHVIPHAGHLMAFERPEEFNRVLREWLEVLPVKQPSRIGSFMKGR